MAVVHVWVVFFCPAVKSVKLTCAQKKLKEAIRHRPEDCMCKWKCVYRVTYSCQSCLRLPLLGCCSWETSALARRQHMQECLDHLGQAPLCVFILLPWFPFEEFDTTSAAYSASLQMKSLQWKLGSYGCSLGLRRSRSSQSTLLKG